MRQPCFYSALSGRQAAFERHWRAFGGKIRVEIAVFWCFARRNVDVHGQIPFSFESFRVVFASNRSVSSKFLFGEQPGGAVEEDPPGGRSGGAGFGAPGQCR